VNNKLTNKKSPFTVPENYFDNLPITVQNKLSHNSSEQSILHKIVSFSKPQLTLGFIMITFAIIGYLTVNIIWDEFPLNPPQTNEFANNSYINTSEFSEQHYLNILLEEKSATNKTEVNNEEYIKYLVDDEIDYASLMNELYYY
jgi:hypothetical protein